MEVASEPPAQASLRSLHPVFCTVGIPRKGWHCLFRAGMKTPKSTAAGLATRGFLISQMPLLHSSLTGWPQLAHLVDWPRHPVVKALSWLRGHLPTREERRCWFPARGTVNPAKRTPWLYRFSAKGASMVGCRALMKIISCKLLKNKVWRTAPSARWLQETCQGENMISRPEFPLCSGPCSLWMSSVPHHHHHSCAPGSQSLEFRELKAAFLRLEFGDSEISQRSSFLVPAWVTLGWKKHTAVCIWAWDAVFSSKDTPKKPRTLVGADQEVISRATLCGAGPLDTPVLANRPSCPSYWDIKC